MSKQVISSNMQRLGGAAHGRLTSGRVLRQVFRARLRSTGQDVAVKVQRPGALATISKDLYVMRRAIGVYERLIRRFTAQTTDYQTLLSTFAEGCAGAHRSIGCAN